MKNIFFKIINELLMKGGSHGGARGGARGTACPRIIVLSVL